MVALSDNAVGDRLHKAMMVLEDVEGATLNGDMALEIARRALRTVSLALVVSETKESAWRTW